MSARKDHSLPNAQTRIMSSPNKLKLGLFGPNLSGGIGGMTMQEGHFAIDDFADAKALAQAADAAGFEALVPIVRWKGFEGPSEFWARSYEPFTWAAGITAVTENITVFTSCLVGVIHPIVAAKMGATVDHISGGRWGLNVVTGWVWGEFKMFGLPMIPREERYRYADEWIKIVNRAWESSEPFDHHGDFFDLEAVGSYPKPVQAPRPIVMNAGMSPSGQEFAINNVDMLYIQLIDDDDANRNAVADIRARAEATGKRLSIWSTCHVVCRPTMEEAEAFVAEYTAKGDLEGAENYARALMAADSVAQQGLRADPDLVNSLVKTSGIRSVVGTPQQVADQLAVFSDIGLDGVALAFVDYDEGVQQYSDLLYPLLKEKGLRA